jgi:hypothetical protein
VRALSSQGLWLNVSTNVSVDTSRVNHNLCKAATVTLWLVAKKRAGRDTAENITDESPEHTVAGRHMHISITVIQRADDGLGASKAEPCADRHPRDGNEQHEQEDHGDQ